MFIKAWKMGYEAMEADSRACRRLSLMDPDQFLAE